jgi:vacuolar-type H+-ATPase subunit E/Vma4
MNKDQKLLAEAYSSILEGKKKNIKGKDIHVATALKAEIKACKDKKEKAKLQAKLAKLQGKIIKEDAGVYSITRDGVSTDSPALASSRAAALERPQNYMSVLKAKGFKQVEGGANLNKFVRGKDLVTVDKDLAGGFVVTINGKTYKGTLDALEKAVG